MATNPFEDDNRRYLVLVNVQNQHSLWPADIPAPAGWRIAHAEDSRRACLDYVDTHWVGFRPATPAGPADVGDFLTHGFSAPAPRQARGESA